MKTKWGFFEGGAKIKGERERENSFEKKST
jgi:hypothetical protein